MLTSPDMNQERENISEYSDHSFRRMADASPMLIRTIDANGLSAYYNKSLLDFIGVSKQEDISDWSKIVHPDDVESTQDTINTAIAERQAYSLECRLLRADGQWRWVLAQGNPRLSGGNEFLGLVGSFVDITSLKEAEEKITKSEKKYRSLFESMDQGFCIVEMIFDKNNKPLDYVFLEVNRVFEDQTGLTDPIGKTAKELLPQLEEKWFEIYGNVARTGKSHRFIEGSDTMGRWFEVYAYKLEEDNRVAILFKDITDRKASEKTLIESESRFRNLVRDATAAIVVLTGPEMKVEIVNEAYCRLVGLETREIMDQPLFTLIPAAEAHYRPLLEKVRQTGEPEYLHDSPYSIQVKEKKLEGFLHIVYQPYRDTEGKILGVMAIHQDVSEAVNARKKIEESEKRFQAAITAVEGIIWTNNAIGEMEGEQPGWAQLTGQSLEEYQGYGWAKAVHPEDAQPTINAWNKAVKNRSIFEFEHRIKTKDSGWKLFSIKAVPSFNEDGTIQQWVGVHTDISEQHETAERIKESEERFRKLADESPIFVFIIERDLQSPVSYWNKTWLNYTGQSAEEAAVRSWDGIIHNDDLPLVREIYTPAFTVRLPYFIPAVRTKRHDGEYRWHAYKGNPKYLANGEFDGYLGVGIDVHDQKLAEEKLAYRTALLEAHNEAAVDGILLVDAKGNILSYNQRFIEIWNMPPHIVAAKNDEAALAFAMTQLVNPQQFIDKVKYLYDHPTETSLDELVFKDGKTVERNGYPVIGENGTYYAWSWTFKDITQRIKIAQDLKNTKDQLELTFKSIPAGVYLINDKGEMIYVNDKGAAVYGDFTPEDLLAKKDLPALLQKADDLFDRFDENGDHFGPENSPAYISLSTGLPSQALLMQINKETKEKRWHYVQGAPLFDEEGKVSMVLITSTDITLQKIAEEKTKESEENFRSLANSIPQLAWMADTEGWIYWYNRRWYNYTGTTLEEMKEGGWEQVHQPEQRNRVAEFVKQAWKKNEPWQLTSALRSADGTYRRFLTEANPVTDAEGKILRWIGTNTDIEDQKTFSEKLEEKVNERTGQLYEANQTLKAKNIELGKMNKELEAFAYVSSHDLQEPLRKIQLLSGYILEKENQNLSEFGKDYFLRMQQAATRMQALIKDLLTFSRLAITDRTFEVTDLGKLINEMKEEFKETIIEKNANIEIAEMPAVEIIPFQFRQLVQNLLSNALKFSKPGVPPRIFFKSKIAKGKELNNEDLLPEEQYCLITVTDNGIGFKPEYAEKIFEVFQKLHRKEEYAGTGIGLAIVKKIIGNHNGIITAESELGEGTVFKIYLPMHINKKVLS